MAKFGDGRCELRTRGGANSTGWFPEVTPKAALPSHYGPDRPEAASRMDMAIVAAGMRSLCLMRIPWLVQRRAKQPAMAIQ